MRLFKKNNNFATSRATRSQQASDTQFETLPSTMNNDVFIFDESGTILVRVKDVSVKSVTIPNGVKKIGNGAFAYCSGLTSIDIPSSVTSIGGHAFNGCSGLTSIDIPSSVTSIGGWAFSRCSSLTSIDIPCSVTSIGRCAFSGCI